MGELIYSILRYEPSIVSGEKINLGAIFFYPDTDYREFFSISKWSRISAFDDTLNIPLLRDLMEDIRYSIGTCLDNPNFDIELFRLKFHSEIHFDKCNLLSDVSLDSVDEEIENIKNLYFQFEYDIAKRPSNDTQKKFLRRLLASRNIQFNRNVSTFGRHGDTITYDYIFREYGVVFFNLNNAKIDNKTMNKVKAWAWNATTAQDRFKLIVLYDLDDSERDDAKPALEIMKATAYQTINIHNGFDEFISFIESAS